MHAESLICIFYLRYIDYCIECIDNAKKGTVTLPCRARGAPPPRAPRGAPPPRAPRGPGPPPAPPPVPVGPRARRPAAARAHPGRALCFWPGGADDTATAHRTRSSGPSRPRPGGGPASIYVWILLGHPTTRRPARRARAAGRGTPASPYYCTYCTVPRRSRLTLALVTLL